MAKHIRKFHKVKKVILLIAIKSVIILQLHEGTGMKFYCNNKIVVNPKCPQTALLAGCP